MRWSRRPTGNVEAPRGLPGPITPRERIALAQMQRLQTAQRAAETMVEQIDEYLRVAEKWPVDGSERLRAMWTGKISLSQTAAYFARQKETQ